MSEKVNIMGLEFNNITLQDAISEAKKLISSKTFTTIFTPNSEILYQCLNDKQILSLFQKGDLIIPDGIGVIYIGKILGQPLLERVTGIDLASSLLPIIESSGYRLYLLGGGIGVAQCAAENIKDQYKNINICGFKDGYFDNDIIAVNDIFSTKPDVVFVCLGSPKQENFIISNKNELPPALYLGIGGSIDIFAKKSKRAPKIFIKLELEWLYRLIKEPKRFTRMLKIPKVILLALFYKFKKTN